MGAVSVLAWMPTSILSHRVHPAPRSQSPAEQHRSWRAAGGQGGSGFARGKSLCKAVVCVGGGLFLFLLELFLGSGFFIIGDNYEYFLCDLDTENSPCL